MTSALDSGQARPAGYKFRHSHDGAALEHLDGRPLQTPPQQSPAELHDAPSARQADSHELPPWPFGEQSPRQQSEA